MPIEVEIVNDSGSLDVVIAVGTVGAALAAAWAAWVANRQNKRLTEPRLRFQSGIEVQGPKSAVVRLVVTNDSFRPTTVRRVGWMPAGELALFNQDNAIEGTPLPVTLQDGEGGEWSFDAALLIGALAEHGPVLQMFAVDSHGVLHTQWHTGNVWRRLRVLQNRRRNLRRFKREARRTIHENRRRKAEEEATNGD
jgi:hypothetical protein